MNARLTPEAEDDLAEAQRWYRQRGSSVPQRFRQAVQAGLELTVGVSISPGSGQLHDRYRGAMLGTLVGDAFVETICRAASLGGDTGTIAICRALARLVQRRSACPRSTSRRRASRPSASTVQRTGRAGSSRLASDRRPGGLPRSC